MSLKNESRLTLGVDGQTIFKMFAQGKQALNPVARHLLLTVRPLPRPNGSTLTLTDTELVACPRSAR
jgi:hypothetical protein